MMKIRQILVPVLWLSAVVMNLAACGQQGPLYLPEAKQTSAVPQPQATPSAAQTAMPKQSPLTP